MPTKIAIIEDDHILSKYISARFRQEEDFEIYTAADGEEGEALIKEQKPDLVLLDIIMPKKNGFEVLEAIKADEATKDIPVIVLSNLGQEGDREKAKALGAVDFFVKVDLEVKEIIEKVKQFLGKE